MRQYEDILVQVYEILQPLRKDHRELTEDTDLVADLGLDSLKVMDLLAEVEDHFDISIPLNVLPDIHTVKDFALQVQKLVGDL